MSDAGCAGIILLLSVNDYFSPDNQCKLSYFVYFLGLMILLHFSVRANDDILLLKCQQY